MSDVSTSSALLLAPALAALVALGIHAWRVRGPRVTAAFFVASLAFGLLRGNFIGWLMHDAARQLGLGGDGGLMPYVMRAPLLRVGYASLVECCGWMLALYLGWTLAEQVLRRVPALSRRLFPLLLLAAVFTASLGYAVEAGANAMHWWTWTLPLRSKFFIEVPAAGIWAWFSVALDFLLPFLLFVESPRRGRDTLSWLALLLFPVHMASNILDLLPGAGAWGLGEPSWLMHLAMLVGVVLLTAFDRRELALPVPAPAVSAAAWSRLPVGAAALVLGVVWTGIVAGAGRWDLVVATAPLLVFILLAIPELPVGSVAVVALASAPFAGGRGSAAAIPLLSLGFLQWLATRFAGRARRRLFAVAVAGLVALTLLWQVARSRAEAAYVRARMVGADWPRALRRLERLSSSVSQVQLEAGNALASAGSHELALDAFREALRLEPDLVLASNGLGLSLLRLGRAAEAAEALEVAARQVPRAEGLQQNLGLAQLAAGRFEAAKVAFGRAHELDPEDPRPTIGLARVAVAQGRAEEAIRILSADLGAARPSPELHLALGGVYEESGRAELAEEQVELAIDGLSGADLSRAYCRLALLLLRLPERLAGAHRAAEAAVAVERSDFALDALGQILIRQERRAEARFILLEALENSRSESLRRQIRQHLAEANVH